VSNIQYRIVQKLTLFPELSWTTNTNQSIEASILYTAGSVLQVSSLKVSLPKSSLHILSNLNTSEYIFFFNLRSYDRINKTPAMNEQERISKVPYQSVQRALAEEIMSEGVHGTGGKVKGKKGRGKGDDSDSDAEMSDSSDVRKAEEEKKDLMDKRHRFEHAAEQVGLKKFNDVDGDRLADSKDSIAENAMLNMPPVSEELWNKDYADQELENFIQEELYIHDKVLIVDDRIAVCGSSNINDRSQLGYHDSELSIVMQDANTLDSTMNGQPYKACHHAATLRRMLWREHLGLLPPQPLAAEDDPNAQPPGDAENDCHNSGDQAHWDKFVEDPLNDELWEMWTKRATVNTEVFRDLFHADPDDVIRTYKDYDEFLPKEAETKSGDDAEVWWKKQGKLSRL
jgi:phospholipase D1/2